MSVDSDFELGQISIHTTDNKGHDPEFWAAQATKKICEYSESAPEHIKQQAIAFQNQVYSVILLAIINAINSKIALSASECVSPCRSKILSFLFLPLAMLITIL